jgi:hypothetical protein
MSSRSFTTVFFETPVILRTDRIDIPSTRAEITATGIWVESLFIGETDYMRERSGTQSKSSQSERKANNKWRKPACGTVT